jgi:lysophospholipase L1-like esterase
LGRALGAQYMRVGDALTRQVNRIIRQVAAAAHVHFVDLYRAFRGTGNRDDTGLLAADGDHPDAAGHRLIAVLLVVAGIAPLR